MDQFQSSNHFQKLTTLSQDTRKLEELELKIIELDRKITEIQGYGEKVSELSIGINELNSKSQQMQEDNLSLSKKMANSEKENTKRSIEILGVFVAIITVISISTTTALQIHSIYHALLFIIAFSLCLLAFVYLIIYILRHETKSVVLAVSSLLVLLIIGAIMFYYCEKNDEKKIINQNTSFITKETKKPIPLNKN